MARKWSIVTRLLVFMPVVWVIGVVVMFVVLLLDGSANQKSIEVFGKRLSIGVGKKLDSGKGL